jgi:hypothetical protein
MCLGGPKIVQQTAPAVPERQASKSPYGRATDAAAAAQAALRRRMGLASTILTSPLGATQAANTAPRTLLGG